MCTHTRTLLKLYQQLYTEWVSKQAEFHVPLDETDHFGDAVLPGN